MPFITEELAHQMGFLAGNDTIMYAPWPEADCFKAVPAEQMAAVDGKFELVRGGRFLKSSYNIPDGKKIAFHVKAVDANALAFLKSQQDSLAVMLNASEITISQDAFDSAANGAAPSQVCGAGTIYLPLAGLIDIAAERAKLEKQQQDITKWLKGTRAKLANDKFVNGAPANVVEAVRSQLAELEEKEKRTAELLACLK